MHKWTELRTAYHVGKLGTVSSAADALGLHRATVNRHIDALEDEMQAKIFIRHAKGYALTELGEEVLRVAEKTQELIDDLSGKARGENARFTGELKLTILGPFASLIMPAIAEFRHQNPQCKVEIEVHEGLARLEYGEAHIAARAGAKPDHPDYIATLFGRVGFNLYAHDDYIARLGLPCGSDDLAGHFLALSETQGARQLLGDWIDEHVLPDMIAISTKDETVLEEAVCAGVGMGFLADHYAAAREDLHPVLPSNPDWEVPVWLVTHVDLHHTQKVQAMLKCIRSVQASTPVRA